MEIATDMMESRAVSVIIPYYKNILELNDEIINQVKMGIT